MFNSPVGLLDRRLAIKRLGSLTDSWTIQIEVLEGMSEISLPIEIADVNQLLKELNARVTSLEFSAHTSDVENPHATTTVQVGADPAGTAAAGGKCDRNS